MPSADTAYAAAHGPSRAWRWKWRRAIKSPWFAAGVSVGLHLLIFGAFWFVVLRDAGADAPRIVPEARLGEPAPISDEPRTVPLRLTQQSVVPAPAVTPLPSVPELPAMAAPALVPVPTSAAPLSASPAAPAAVSAAAPQASFFGQTGNAYKVVYVVDVSASLMIYMDEIIAQMQASIDGLLPTQRFHVVVTGSREVIELPHRRLVPALSRYRRDARTFFGEIRRVQYGRAEPIEAMRRAFAVGPELIYFLTDGDYRDVEKDLEAELQRMNPDRKVAITTIGFAPSPRARGLLERIAGQHHGHVRIVEPER